MTLCSSCYKKLPETSKGILNIEIQRPSAIFVKNVYDKDSYNFKLVSGKPTKN